MDKNDIIFGLDAVDIDGKPIKDRVYPAFNPEEHVLRPDNKIITGKDAVICIDGKPIAFAKEVSYNINTKEIEAVNMWTGYPDFEDDDDKKEEPKISDFITEIQKLTLDDDETLVIKVPQEMLDETFLSQMQQMLIAAFGDKVRRGKVMIVPDGVSFEKIKEKKPHPIYGDSE